MRKLADEMEMPDEADSGSDSDREGRSRPTRLTKRSFEAIAMARLLAKLTHQGEITNRSFADGFELEGIYREAVGEAIRDFQHSCGSKAAGVLLRLAANHEEVGPLMETGIGETFEAWPHDPRQYETRPQRFDSARGSARTVK